ncbi:hypothetical protein GLOIN_2v1820840 [Rhizophagus irregularis DAOM 181602=DAOM 197198]|nr:hypothetical protein GLOIN_2v1820840 [Rhizophagus irregularis DAOM 181602=DAOM 197198]
MATSNRTCDRCGKAFATPQKLCEHQNRKFLCKPTAKPQDPTPEIVQLQPQPEQLQELIPEVIPAPAEKTPNLSIDELAKWLAGPGDYRGRWCDIQFVKRVHDPARSHKSLKHKTVWQADLKPNVRDIPGPRKMLIYVRYQGA